MAINLVAVPISWARNIMERAEYKPPTEAGLPGLYYRRDLDAGTAELSESAGGQPYLTYVCPCGCGVVGVLPLCPFPGQTGWDWEQAENMRVAPTISPSARRKFACRWHGHLKKGTWTPCDDWLALARETAPKS